MHHLCHAPHRAQTEQQFCLHSFGYMTRMVRMTHRLNYCQRDTNFYLFEISDFLRAYGSNIDKGISKCSETLNQMIGSKSRVCVLNFIQKLQLSVAISFKRLTQYDEEMLDFHKLYAVFVFSYNCFRHLQDFQVSTTFFISLYMDLGA